MRFAAAVSALALAGAAMAQNDTIIKVGEVNGTMALKFDPPFVNITQPNSTVTFIFDGVPGNHTVAQSTFANPCEPMEGGFNSGFFFVNSSSGPFGTWTLTVTDVNTPIWFYCAQQTPKVHCTAGMVGAINPPATGNTFDKFAAQASSAATVVYPSTVLSGAGAFATAGVASTTLPSGSSPTGSGSSGSGSGTGTGSGAPSASSPSSAGSLSTNGFVAFLAAAFGVAIL
ncbi:hypothetical protein L226DRAFT_571536 [Lentinus tigrinus ALCF2SS1-7]|uniref:Cupredoxin n=1 Tax=Lentinus tigrinus ALCF2SS1-6 TaxID=1328759 RepID=A0A5C2SL55_9APHY|nr:hypothetical protein L227DRAFT_574030 [Lentinus tigrinus ALCF2SS1-6]RPD74675.1 hypothetical protein L226DRAFT_571536 [Lentinus tigrinus ALCF2SS1-7]